MNRPYPRTRLHQAFDRRRCGWCGEWGKASVEHEQADNECAPLQDYLCQMYYQEEYEREVRQYENQLWWDTLRHEGGYR